MRDGNDGAVLKHVASQSSLQHSISLHVYRRRCLIEYYPKTVSRRNMTEIFKLPRIFVGVSSALANETNCRCPADKFEPAPPRQTTSLEI